MEQIHNHYFWNGARDDNGMPAPTGYDPALDNIELPSDCERDAVLTRAVHSVDGLGFFVFQAETLDADLIGWADVYTVTARAVRREWRVTGRAIINFDALPWIAVHEEHATVVFDA